MMKDRAANCQPVLRRQDYASQDHGKGATFNVQ
jgi:hypothetical protein